MIQLIVFFIAWVIFGRSLFWPWAGIEDRQDETNRLLREQLRLAQLSPTERATEDAWRKAERAALAVERAEDERVAKNIRRGLAIVLGTVLAGLSIGWVLTHTNPIVLSVGFCLAVWGLGWWSVRSQARQ